MWDTSYGDRTLQGAEAHLFANGLLGFLDEACTWDIENHSTDIAIYDQLSAGQRLSVLRDIARGLFRDDVESIPRTASLDVTIVAIFAFIEAQVLVELEMGDMGSGWRQDVIKVFEEIDCLDTIDLSNTSSDDWKYEIDMLANRILSDRDCFTGEMLMDPPPEEAEGVKVLLGIKDAYLQDIPEDLSEDSFQGTLSEIRRLCSPFADAADQAF